MSTAIINKSNFEDEVINSELPVLVDFFATWCGPCKMLAPTIEEVEAESADTVKFCKIDIDEDAELAMKYGIMSVPTLMLFKGGEPVKKSIGVISKDELLELIK
jgi:thioredoxin 1